MAPDLATIYFDIEGYGFELADAADTLRVRTEAVREALRALDPGLELLPSGFRAGPNPQQPRMYNPQAAPVRTSQDNVALNGLQVRVDDLERLPEILSALSGAGVRQIAGVVFEHSDAGAIQNRLFETAVANARMQAEALAAGLGGSLGPVLYAAPDRAGFDQGFNRVVQAVSYGGGMMNVQPVDLRIRAMVETRWRFVPE